MKQQGVLLCWHAQRAGIDVLRQALTRLGERGVEIGRVLYLVQPDRYDDPPSSLQGASIDTVRIRLVDPTNHREVYEQVCSQVLPELHRLDAMLHINISPGTPAMHSIWLLLHAGGRLPADTKLWSTQFVSETNETRLDVVDFEISTYLSEIQRHAQLRPDDATYAPDARSAARRAAMERLHRYAGVAGAPLLVLGERGTGKTRLVESFVAVLKGRAKVVTVPCGGLDSSLAESLLFGHSKGAFTGAASKRPGLLAEADKGILFLDEVQDLPATIQRKLVRVFQDRHRRYRPLGSDKEESVDVELVCASNLPEAELRKRLDADLYDRLSHLTVTVPPLRECREDLKEDWHRVWQELRQTDELPEQAPWSSRLQRALQCQPLAGNMRDLQKLALLCMAWQSSGNAGSGLDHALDEWLESGPMDTPQIADYGEGSRTERLHWFRRQLAQWAKEHYGTWARAAKALGCDEKTLRDDMKQGQKTDT
ncbi:sigma-54-dependent transcriptional regulator [Stutzerimonas nitrititolerans]|uniref:sigma-54-dependent transcriptional regulator n=1 Tax=Stutzerimonas nitrititolerans TaxID=2482751 RepID=UPI0028A935B2|nr:sigma 54-interacting transcriptional regulator [Stutzerimonas nitrititolerans]